MPVLVAPIVTVPDPLASIVRFAFVPDEMTAAATFPAAVAPVILRPAACDAVDESTTKAGFVAPAKPAASATADALVTVTDVEAATVVKLGLWSIEDSSTSPAAVMTYVAALSVPTT